AETAAVLQSVSRPDAPDAVLLHGPLINPAAPYGLEDFPAYGLDASRRMLGDFEWNGDDEARQFVAFYLELLERIEATGRTAGGVVERAIGRDPVVIRAVLNSLQDSGAMKKDDVRRILDELILYGLNDASVLDVVFQEGEYLRPLPVQRQGPE